MDSFTVSIFAKKTLGFFLTQSKKSDNLLATKQHELYEGAHKLAIDQLREKKVRSANVHENWSTLQDIAGLVEQYIDKFCDDIKLDVIPKATGSSLSQAYAIVQSALGQYNSVNLRIREQNSKNVE